MSKLIPIELPPGMMGNGTDLDAKGRWRDGNLVRWYNGKLRPVGGWMRFTPAPLPEVVRAVLTWRDNAGYARLAAGTASKLYMHDGAIASDITPVGLVPGRDSGSVGLGYGADEYGMDEYGTPRASSGLVLDATVWDLDNFGQNLIAFSPADGRIWQWVPPNAGVRAALLAASAPVDNAAVLVTDERSIVALGADGDGRRVSWCSLENATDWTSTATNTAGSLQLNTNGKLMNGRRMPGEILLWTDVDLHTLRFQGVPFVYGTQRVSTNCGLIGRKAHAAAQGFAAWMGQRSFFIYDGGAVRPLPSEVQERVFNDLNYLQASKIIASNNSQYSEIWWYYPSANSADNDSYVMWNYKENWWATGKLARTAWADREVWQYPIAGAPDGNLYQQEQGWTAAGDDRSALIFAESAPVDFDGGDRMLAVTQLIPDNPGGVQLSYTFETQLTPNSAVVTAGPYSQMHDGYLDARFTGRQARIIVRPQTDGLFNLGILRLDATTGGRR